MLTFSNEDSKRGHFSRLFAAADWENHRVRVGGDTENIIWYEQNKSVKVSIIHGCLQTVSIYLAKLRFMSNTKIKEGNNFYLADFTDIVYFLFGNNHSHVA